MMIWVLYNIVFVVGFVLALPYFAIRAWRRGGYGRGFSQRLGLLDAATRARLAERPRVWIQAVSVGEVFVALRFMDELRVRRPDLGFLLTVTTSTGFRVAEKQVHPDDVLLCFPLDFFGVVRRYLAAVRPCALVLTESELWPNLIHCAHKRGVPVILINGRISESAFRGYWKARVFFRRTVREMALFLVQEQVYAQRLADLGACEERIHVVGSAKYEVVTRDDEGEVHARETLASVGFQPDDPLIVAGSTWPGEERILMAHYARLKQDHPSIRLLLAPRHMERAGEVVKELRRKGLRFVRRSAVSEGTAEPGRHSPDVLLLDTTGELKHFYAHATVIFVGKSLTHHGGHNIIEAALYGKPVLVGPFMENFQTVVDDLLGARAILQVSDAEELGARLGELLADPHACAGWGERAGQAVLERRGVVRASVERMQALIARPT